MSIEEVGAWAETRYDNGMVFMKFGGEGFDIMLQQMKQMLCSRYLPASQEWCFPDTPVGHNEFVRCFGNQLLVAKDQQIDEAAEANWKEPVVKWFQNETHPAWDHQLRAFTFARALEGSVLNMDMGTGKTKVALDLMQDQAWYCSSKDEAHVGIALVLCPKTVIPVWGRQVEAHGPEIDVTLLTKGTVANKTDEAQRAVEQAEWKLAEGHAGQRETALIVINYESAWREPFALWALEQEWHSVTFDEIHKIKSWNGKASRFCARLAKKARRRLGMSGTIMPHSPADAFGIYRSIDPGVFGTSFSKFKSRYCEMGGFQAKQIVGFTRQDEMAALMGYVTFSCSAEDVLDLPDKLDVTREVELTKKEWSVYNEMEKEMIVELDKGTLTAANGLTKLLRLQQITSGVTPAGPVDPDHNSKAEALKGVLEEIGREPIVVFCRFRADLEQVEKTCASLDWNYGEVSGSRKDVDGVWEGDEFDVVGVQIQAGGLGIDLTKARHAIYLSMGFSLGDYEQSRARIHRPGQERKCVYTHIVAKDTIDEAVYHALSNKKEVIEGVLNHMNHFSSMSREAPTKPKA